MKNSKFQHPNSKETLSSKLQQPRAWFLMWLGLVVFLLTGCESTDGGSQVSGSVYYGKDLYDPWYYGGIYDDPDMIVAPPDRPEAPPRPAHPIATPPAPRPTPMPSIPSTPRPSVRR